MVRKRESSRPGPFSGAGHECFESWRPQNFKIPTKLCPGIDSCCTDANTPALTLGARPLQWAVTPKLTMIAGRQLSIGAASGAKPPSRLQNNRGVYGFSGSECGK